MSKTKEEDFIFVPPPEAPVFKPTWEEFQDALGYINKIRPIAEQSGICKIIPPPDWQPPFAVDVDNFKFTPRIQRINELEAHTRIKLNFLDQIAKFWELQGSSLKIPLVERRALDLYSLHKNVRDEGGIDTISRERKWSKVCARMGYPSSKNIGTLLKSHYERILLPYDIFNRGKCVPLKSDEANDCSSDKDYKPHKIPSRMAGKIPDSEKNGRRSKRYPDNQSDLKEDSDDEGKGSKELKRLQFYGPGPKMAGFENEKVEEKGKTRGKKIDFYDYDPLSKYICLNCGRGDAENQMLLCDGCDDSYHTFCLIPMLTDVPKGDWRCPKCVAVEVSKPLEAFGFEQAQKEYTLQSFGEMADKFKQDYFNMPVHTVPTELAEQEYWRIVSSIDEDVTVEYGADLHTMDHGSGFPTKKSKNLLPADQEYASSSWNLNNLPIVEGSILGHINCDISGMKVPWMYVGMCFSTFCWHNEDHWSYSINYLHWGEAKTWYGVPGGGAEEFEEAMRGAACELFDAQPDLLHQLVTIMNPNIIMKSGVSIVRTDQHAGEFVITFPRSYHAGFNQGYNFAEAVNFCPPDWLSIGRDCVTHYSNLKRYCVFSHDELVCTMASNPDALDLIVAAATYQDLIKMFDLERTLRKEILKSGITISERENFELMPDDERQCEYCKTTFFLSAIACSCQLEKLVCLKHYDKLCDCESSKKSLLYRYTLDEFNPMLNGLKSRAETFDNWTAKVKAALEAEHDDKLELQDLRELLDEAEAETFPDNELMQNLIQSVSEAEKCATVAAHIANKKVRTRTRGSGEPRPKLTLGDLSLFNEQIQSLPCTIKEADSVNELLNQVKSFKKVAVKLLEEDEPDSEDLEEQVELGYSFEIYIPELAQLKYRYQQIEWIEEAEECKEDKETLTAELIKSILKQREPIVPCQRMEYLAGELYQIQLDIEKWTTEATELLKNEITIQTGMDLLDKAEKVEGHLPLSQNIKDAVKKSKEWIAKVDAIKNAEEKPLLEVIENLVQKGRSIPMILDELPILECNVDDARSFIEKISRLFLNRNSNYSLLEVLVPRGDIGLVSNKRKRLKRDDYSAQQQLSLLIEMNAEEEFSKELISKTYSECEEREMGALRAIRAHNKGQNPHSEMSTFCICHKMAFGEMIECALCLNKFHWACMPTVYRKNLKSSNSGRFICMSCDRSRRPRLDTVLTMLMSIEKIPIRLVEAEALDCLVERALMWQAKARQLLHNEEISAAHNRLAEFSQMISEAQHQNELDCVKAIVPKLESDSSTEEDFKENGGSSTAEESSYKSDTEWEHGYSSGNVTNGIPNWNKTLQQLGASDCTAVTLSPDTRQKVSDLLIEGEILEITVKELNYLARLYQASVHRATDLSYSFFFPSAASDKKMAARKRKSECGEPSPHKKGKPSLTPVKPFVKKLLKPFTGKMVRKKSMKRRPRQMKSEGGSESDVETDESCSAEKCLHPLGHNVEWVQCDGCDLWFHYVCVGLKKNDVKEDEDYLCNACVEIACKTKIIMNDEENADLLLNFSKGN